MSESECREEEARECLSSLRVTVDCVRSTIYEL